jgi:pilus assembly protein Flp/PilA
MNALKRLWKDEEGQDMVEYGLLVALIGVVVAGVIPALTTAIAGTFTAAETAMS